MNNLFIREMAYKFLASVQSAWRGREQERFSVVLSFTEASRMFPNRNDLHAYMHHHYFHQLPPQLRGHRRYFMRRGRGFGENALHAMWYLIFKEFRPKRCLEIGVYRGQVISLWTLIARILEIPCEVHGISPFTHAGDRVSNYIDDIDYIGDTLGHFRHFELKEPVLVKSFSNDVTGLEHIRSCSWDVIYIDGNHDYEVALADYQECKKNLSRGGLLIMDDSSLYTDFVPPRFSFAGHPGPSRIVCELAMKELIFVGGVGHNNIFLKE